ncbi:hypothetical protein G418_17575 [Rhodococcus qingshengii BKS 20-40]|nr:hypothetical protein G418_17575 [Rhodococcus qingshengii BKS 20-40]
MNVLDQHAKHPRQGGRYVQLVGSGLSDLIEGVVEVLLAGEQPRLEQRLPFWSTDGCRWNVVAEDQA